MPTITPQLALRLGLALLVALLVAALFIMRANLAACQEGRRADRAALALSNASIDTLTASLAKVTNDQKKLAADDAARIAATQEALDMARAADKWRTAAIDRLQTSAAAIEPSSTNVQLCEASDAVKAVWQ